MINPILTDKSSEKLDSLPLKLRKKIESRIGHRIDINKLSPKFEKVLLESINNEEITLSKSPIFPDRMEIKWKELLVWLSFKFSVFMEPNRGDLINCSNSKLIRRLILVYIDKFAKYELFWEDEIKDTPIYNSSPKIITDNKEILLIIAKTRKKNHQLLGQLPYLGAKEIGDKLILFEEEIERPNYSKIKFNRLICIKDCIRILLGVETISLISEKDRLFRDLGAITDDKEKSEDNGWDKWLIEFLTSRAGWKKNSLSSYPTQKAMKYRDEWLDIIFFIYDFVKKILNESMAGFIDKYDFEKLDRDTPLVINNGSYRCYFQTLPFIKWAKKSGYAIPDELSFIENDDGTFKWADSDQTNELDLDNIENSGGLLGKERQELGRLKKEKITMDLTVEAAIAVGKYIEKAKSEGRLIVKGEISDLINHIDRKIPDTRIDLIWKSIPDDIKSGPGRPKKA